MSDMSTWRTGADAMHRMQYRDAMKIDDFRRQLFANAAMAASCVGS
jgi:hypothetical protein